MQLNPLASALRRQGSVGAPPGTIVVDPNAHASSIQVMAYSATDFTEAVVDEIDQIGSFLDEWPVTWINVNGLGDIDVIHRLGDLFGLHRLALEDVVNLYQRAKVEEYGNSLFVTTRMVRNTQPFETEQVSLFVGERFVLTFQQYPGDCLNVLRERIRAKRGRVRYAGSDYLAYAILDTIIDHYFPALEEYGERLDTLENEALDKPTPEILPRVREVKRDLMSLRRAIWPHREALNSLMRDPVSFITQETRIYLRDCYDHVIRLMDITENFRELSSDLMDVYLSSLSNRMNEIMKTLTVIASIFIPLTFIVGIYGMNFDIEASPWNMPELYTYLGYPVVMGIMLLIALAMIWYFRRKHWIR